MLSSTTSKSGRKTATKTDVVNAGKIRKALGLSRGRFARALNVTERTVQRWDAGEFPPTGAAQEILAGIHMALEDEGADVERISRRVSVGIATVLHRGLSKR